MRRVVITGLGAVSPCGKDAPTTWANVAAGRSGIARITLFDPTEFSTQIAGECRGFNPEDYIEKKRVREMGRFIHLAIAAADEALRHSGFKPSDAEKEEFATIVGVGFCGIEYFEATCATLIEKGPKRVTPYFIPATIANLAPGQISMRHGLRGPSYTTTSACASGAHAIGEAFHAIRGGTYDFAIAGGTEAAVTPIAVAGFGSMRALSKRNDDPTKASRPYDKGRDGFVIAEGAGLMVLEERESAVRRGAVILGEVVGYGSSSDAYHLTQPAPAGEGAQRAMRRALRDARLNPAAIDYVNAHGTSTPSGDLGELEAIRSVFGDHTTSGLSVSSTKSMTGHLLGAAGGLEAVLTTQAIGAGLLPPTINVEDPEDACAGFDLVANRAKERKVSVAMSNSFGFGGTNATLIIRKHDA